MDDQGKDELLLRYARSYGYVFPKSGKKETKTVKKRKKKKEKGE